MHQKPGKLTLAIPLLARKSREIKVLVTRDPAQMSTERPPPALIGLVRPFTSQARARGGLGTAEVGDSRLSDNWQHAASLRLFRASRHLPAWHPSAQPLTAIAMLLHVL